MRWNKGSRSEDKSGDAEDSGLPAVGRPITFRSFGFPEMDRFMEHFWNDWHTPFDRFGLSVTAGPVRRSEIDGMRKPFVDLQDLADELVITAEFPGLTKDDVEIELVGNTLKLKGKVETTEEAEEDGYIRRERSYQSYFRELTLPEEVLPDKAHASVNNGVLEIKIPKKTPAPREEAHIIQIE